jgi:hypothetical protein
MSLSQDKRRHGSEKGDLLTAISTLSKIKEQVRLGIVVSPCPPEFKHVVPSGNFRRRVCDVGGTRPTSECSSDSALLAQERMKTLKLKQKLRRSRRRQGTALAHTGKLLERCYAEESGLALMAIQSYFESMEAGGVCENDSDYGLFHEVLPSLAELAPNAIKVLLSFSGLSYKRCIAPFLKGGEFYFEPEEYSTSNGTPKVKIKLSLDQRRFRNVLILYVAMCRVGNKRAAPGLLSIWALCLHTGV